MAPKFKYVKRKWPKLPILSLFELIVKSSIQSNLSFSLLFLLLLHFLEPWGKWILQVAQKSGLQCRFLFCALASARYTEEVRSCKKFCEILRGCGLKLELFDWKEIELNDSNYAVNSPNLQRLRTKWFRKKKSKGIQELTTQFFMVLMKF